MQPPAECQARECAPALHETSRSHSVPEAVRHISFQICGLAVVWAASEGLKLIFRIWRKIAILVPKWPG